MNDIVQIVDSKKEYFDSLKQMQEQVFDNDDVDQVISFIKESNILSKKEFLLHLLQIIRKCVFIRPKKINFLLSIITFLKDHILKDFPHFRWTGFHIPSNFLGELRKMGVYNPMIIQLKNPDLEKYNSIIETIKNDDINTFQDTLAHTNIDINTQMNFKNYKIDRTQNPSFLDISAFFGSMKIFKFLFMNNVRKGRMIANFAVAGGNYEIIHILEGENISFTDLSVVQTAIKFFRNDIVEYLEPSPNDAIKLSLHYSNIDCLLKNLNDIDSKFSIDSEFNQICFKIAKNGYSELLRIACVLNPNCVNIESPTHQYMLHQAIFYGNDEMATFLIENKNTDLNIQNGEQKTPIFFAVQRKNIKIIELLCSNEKVDLNVKSFSGDTCLHHALRQPSIDVIKSLLKYKSRINSTAITNEQLTYMHLSILTKDLQIVKLINSLDEKLRQLPNKEGSTPLIYSVLNGTPEIVDYLCSFDDVDVNAKNSDGFTSLHLANKNPPVLQILCNKQGIDFNIKNNEGNTPLHLAAKEGKIESVKILIGFEKVDVNALNNNNNTPLHLAVENGFFEIVKILIGLKNIDPKIKNKDGI